MIADCGMRNADYKDNFQLLKHAQRYSLEDYESDYLS